MQEAGVISKDKNIKFENLDEFEALSTEQESETKKKEWINLFN